jgi:glutaredoxin
MKARWAVALMLLAIAGAADAQYRWRDASGQVNYGDIPSPDSSDVQRVDSRAPVARADSSTTLPFELRRATAHFPAVLYTSSECAPCDSARSFLRERGVPYSERTVEAPEDVEILRRLTGADKVPVLTLGRERFAGFNSAAWSRGLDLAGYPAQSRLPPGYTAEPPQPLIARASGPANRIGPAAAAR